MALENGNVSVFRLGRSKSKLSLAAVTIKRSLKRRKRRKERFRLELREVNKEKKLPFLRTPKLGKRLVGLADHSLYCSQKIGGSLT